VDLRVDRNSELPLGTQLAWKLRAGIDSGRLRTGDRLPSLRDAAEAAGVNVNTVRAVYARLERSGLLRSEQGRGTFVTGQGDGDAAARRELRAQISALESELARRPPPPTEATPRPRSTPGATMQSAQELALIRDDLMERLQELDAARAEVLRRLRDLPAAEEETAAAPSQSGRSSLSLAGARVRWVGA
jgi:DNA-binding transcriptional regulator YhcF (GntR family)